MTDEPDPRTDTDPTSYGTRVDTHAPDVEIHPDDQYDQAQIPAEYLDHISWYIVSTIDNFCPIDESAENVIDALAEEADEWGETNEAWERGYHSGAFATMEDLARFLWDYDIDVKSRAERYQQVHDLPEFEATAEDIQASAGQVLARSRYDPDADDSGE